MKTAIKLSPFILLILGLAMYNFSISHQALNGGNERVKTLFITLEIIIPLIASAAAQQFKRAQNNRFLFGMFGLFAGFLISLDLFVVAMYREV
ncbi:hypothetical protein [Aneurinibacillus terranovensis]|uniref:hypothetical protein n=1 Tax=Aneurinibacillus terranovensis TaxID=278991 RepID=UPI0004187929|nr:hypothetical protein [Aneurinibacillus terranovensis]